ncbi:MAG: bacteriohemerythrin [Halodesulfurarchaeum sp.]
MAYIEWDQDRYGVGVEHIDSQHRQLFETLSELHAAMREGRGRDELGDILAELARYTDQHFGDEEAFMRECGYSGDCSACFRAHVDAHDTFEDRVAEIRERYEAGERTVSLETLEFLRTWLTNHIAGNEQDQDYASYYAAGTS